MKPLSGVKLWRNFGLQDLLANNQEINCQIDFFSRCIKPKSFIIVANQSHKSSNGC